MPPARPNLLFVFGDQWRYNAVGYAGNDEVHTPHLDALRAESIDLALAVSGCPVCTPARASLLTGVRPLRHGLFLNDAPLNPDLPSIGKTLSEAGYATGWIGKWHVNAGGRHSYIPPERRHGFQHFQALECTHDYNQSRYFEGDDPTPRQWDGYDAIAQTSAAVNFMQAQADRDDPFALFLSWGPPHSPYETAPEAYRALYDPNSITLPPNVPEYPEYRAKVAEDLAGYYAHCTALDDCIARLVESLRQSGQLENTWLVFTSAHGDLIGAHGLYDKQGPWEESLRVPCLVRVPDAPENLRGATSNLLHDFVDWFPTLCGWLGLEPPPDLQGRDHGALLLNETLPEPNDALYACYHAFGNWVHQSRGKPAWVKAREARGVRTERFTYVEDHDGPWLLYDNEADPYQLRNRVNDAELAEVQRNLAARLRELLAENGDEFRPGMDYVRQWGYAVDASGTIPFK
ncbi:MAG: sulfatase-like hydrolase/transferase [Opitutales bacterium]